MSTLITNVGELVTNAAPHGDPGQGPGSFAALTGAALVIDDGRVAWTGPAGQAPAADDAVDCGGRAVLPGFVDSHAHLVFAGERSAEFAARMAGQPYQAGGIRSTVAATRAAPDDDLRANLARLTREMLAQGTTTLECKSGYGLTIEDECKLLRVIRRIANLRCIPTFLGAHEIPDEYRGRASAYADLVIHQMLPQVASERLAEYCDVFCEPGIFSIEESRRVLSAARALGLPIESPA